MEVLQATVRITRCWKILHVGTDVLGFEIAEDALEARDGIGDAVMLRRDGIDAKFIPHRLHGRGR